MSSVVNSTTPVCEYFVSVRVLLIKPAGSMCEECCCGASMDTVLPAQIVHATRMLRAEGFDATLNDLQVQPPAELAAHDVAVVWVSVFDTLFEDVQLVTEAKRVGLHTVVVLNDPTGLERRLMDRFSEIDALVRLHERERTLLSLLQALDTNGAFPDTLVGTMVRRGGTVTDQGERPPEGDSLSFLPDASPVLEQLPLESYDRMVILTGRGCPHNCAFCQYRHTPVRKRRIDDILAEYDLLARRGANHITLQDINFFSDPEWAINLLKALSARSPRPTVSIDCRLEDLLDLERLWAMQAGGVVHATVGVETMSTEVQKEIHKAVPLTRLDEALRNAHRRHIMPHLSFVIGLPSDTCESLTAIERTVKKGRFVLFDISPVIPPVGSPLYEQYRTEGLLEEDTLEAYVTGLTGRPLVHSRGLTAEDLQRFRDRMYRYAASPINTLRYALSRGPRAVLNAVIARMKGRRSHGLGRRL